MISLFNLQSFLKRLLYFDNKIDASAVDPHMANGLMVKGKELVKKIGFGVSASLALFEKAKKKRCDVLIVHHVFNLPQHHGYDKIFQDRIAFLIKNNISLFGFHYLLDAHPKIGNNVKILETIGAEAVKPTVEIHGVNWGWQGKFTPPLTFEKIVEKLKPHLSKQAVIFDFGPKKVKRVIACSGKGAPYASGMQQLLDEKIDLYITGEAHEWNRELFREAGINFIAGGHYATEVFGVKALMGIVREQFPHIQVEFLDLWNEV